MSIYVKFEHSSYIGLKVILFFVCFDSYIKSLFVVLICKFEKELVALQIQFFMYSNKMYSNKILIKF